MAASLCDRPLGVALFRDVAEDQDHAREHVARVMDGGAAVGDRVCAPVARDQERVVGEPDDVASPDDAPHGALDGRAGALVDDAEDLLDRPAEASAASSRSAARRPG